MNLQSTVLNNNKNSNLTPALDDASAGTQGQVVKKELTKLSDSASQRTVSSGSFSRAVNKFLGRTPETHAAMTPSEVISDVTIKNVNDSKSVAGNSRLIHFDNADLISVIQQEVSLNPEQIKTILSMRAGDLPRFVTVSPTIAVFDTDGRLQTLDNVVKEDEASCIIDPMPLLDAKTGISSSALLGYQFRIKTKDRLHAPAQIRIVVKDNDLEVATYTLMGNSVDRDITIGILPAHFSQNVEVVSVDGKPRVSVDRNEPLLNVMVLTEKVEGGHAFAVEMNGVNAICYAYPVFLTREIYNLYLTSLNTGSAGSLAKAISATY